MTLLCGLARDGIPAVRQPDRVVCIAGKPAPTGFAVVTKIGVSRVPLCAGLLAMVSLRCASQTALFVSQASQLPLVLRWSQKSGSAAYLCGSGLARDGSPEVRQPDRVVCIAGKPAPTGFAVVTKSAADDNPCGSGLARDSDDAASQSHHGDAIAGRPAPTDNAALTKSAAFQATKNPAQAGFFCQSRQRFTQQRVLLACGA